VREVFKVKDIGERKCRNMAIGRRNKTSRKDIRKKGGLGAK